jgi:hypothetical protein
MVDGFKSAIVGGVDRLLQGLLISVRGVPEARGLGG